MLAGAIPPIMQPSPGMDDDLCCICFCFVTFGRLSFKVEETTSSVYLYFYTTQLYQKSM